MAPGVHGGHHCPDPKNFAGPQQKSSEKSNSSNEDDGMMGCVFFDKRISESHEVTLWSQSKLHQLLCFKTGFYPVAPSDW